MVRVRGEARREGGKIKTTIGGQRLLKAQGCDAVDGYNAVKEGGSKTERANAAFREGQTKPDGETGMLFSIRIDSDRFGSVAGHPSLVLARQAAKRWAQEHLRGKCVTNASTGRAMLMSMQGVKHTLRTRRDAESIAALSVLDQLAEQARFEGYLPKRDDGKPPIVVNKAGVLIDGERCVAEIRFNRVKVKGESIDVLDDLEVFDFQKVTKEKDPAPSEGLEAASGPIPLEESGAPDPIVGDDSGPVKENEGGARFSIRDAVTEVIHF